MISIIISVVAAFATTFIVNQSWPGHIVWSILFGVLAFFLVTLVVNLILKKKLEAAYGAVQKHIMDKQEYLNRKIRSIGMRATPKFQHEIEMEQAQSIRDAIALLDTLKPYEKWNLMVKRQTDTLRAQFYYQLKDYENADKFFKNSLLMDPLIMAMQMARHYKNGKMDQVEKCFLKGVRRFKDEKAVIIFGLYSWILVKENRIDDAIKVLLDAKTKAENDTLKQNWNHLVNGSIKRFSNAGLGEQWYALMLETPKQQRIQAQPFGGHRKF